MAAVLWIQLLVEYVSGCSASAGAGSSHSSHSVGCHPYDWANKYFFIFTNSIDLVPLCLYYLAGSQKLPQISMTFGKNLGQGPRNKSAIN